MEMEGWAVLQRHLARLSQEVAEYYFSAETGEEFQYRKGYLDGHMRTLAYADVLLTVAETSDEEYAQAELGKLLAPFRQVALPSIEQASGEVQERISRVMEAARQSHEQPL